MMFLPYLLPEPPPWFGTFVNGVLVIGYGWLVFVSCFAMGTGIRLWP